MKTNDSTSESSLLEKAVLDLKRRFQSPTRSAIVLGSGFACFIDDCSIENECASNEISGVAGSSVVGHPGKILLARVKGYSEPFLMVAGRLHGYEGHTPRDAVRLLRALRLWGTEAFILTNASGSTTKKLKPGELVVLQDHINLTGQNPLTGRELFNGPRFPDMSNLYDRDWRKRLQSLYRKEKKLLKEAVYTGVAGPSFETPAEIRAFAKLGGHIVGMSTVWEAIALKQMGARILGLSMVANFGSGLTRETLTHEEVLATMKNSSGRMTDALRKALLCL